MTGSASRFFQPAGGKRKRTSETAPKHLALFLEAPESSSSSSSSSSQGCAENPLVIDVDTSSEEGDGHVSMMKTEVVDASQQVPEKSNPQHDEQQQPTRSSPLPNPRTDLLVVKEPLLSEHRELPPSTESSESSPQQKENPFAQFAHKSSTDTSHLPARSGLSWHVSQNRKGTKTTSTSTSTSKSASKVVEKQNKNCEFVPMKSIPEEEQDRITRKWHSLADPSAPLEVRRFQVLLAARLHTRCQEPTVRKAMAVLREVFPDLTAPTVSKADPEILACYINNLQYYNTKAKQIVKAAREIEINYNGIVPEDEASLLKITGVGKVFADLLAFVNTRAAHEKIESSKSRANGPDSTLSVEGGVED